MEGIADSVGAPGTGGRGAAADALQTEQDGCLPGGHIADGHRHKIGADTLKALLQAAGMLGLDGGQAADAAGEDHAEPCAVDVFQDKAAVLNSFDGGGHGKLGEAGHLAGFAAVKTSVRIKVLDLGSQLDLEIRRVKGGDRPHGAAACLDGGPAFLHGAAGRVDCAKTGYDDSAFVIAVHS